MSLTETYWITLGVYSVVEQQVVLATMSDRQLSVVVSEFEAAIRLLGYQSFAGNLKSKQKDMNENLCN